MTVSQFISAIALSAVIAIPADPAAADPHEFSPNAVENCTLEGADAWRESFDTPTPAEQEILDLETLICRMFAERQIDALADTFLAEDGIILLDGAGLADGRDAQRDLFRHFVSQGFDLAWEPVRARVSQSGDMAWAIGMVEVTYPDGTIEHAKYASIWERINGDWQNVVEMRNGNGDLGPGPF